MLIEQFYDEGLAHASYAVISEHKMVLIDPGRDTKPYEDFAQKHKAEILAVFETHPHADFISSHLELHERLGADIYINPRVGVSYPHIGVDHEDEIKFGKVLIRTLFTPGHSPDHNTYLLLDETGNEYAVFTGDSLFVGDVGRPDLRESAGTTHGKKEELARQMFRTMQGVFRPLPNDVLVYPSHGPGSLCGKATVNERFSTIGKERNRNWALQLEDETEFVNQLLDSQPFAPSYFPYDVQLNVSGFRHLDETLAKVPRLNGIVEIDAGILLIDTRKQTTFRKGHLPGAINIPDDRQFETWLGTIVKPDEMFYLLAADKTQLEMMIYKAGKIGYETLIKGALTVPANLPESFGVADEQQLRSDPQHFHILDVRNRDEVAEYKPFASSFNIPLPELREKVKEIPNSKPLVVHCAAGFRSSVASSIIKKDRPELDVLDLSFAIKNF